MNPIEKAIEALERIEKFEYAYASENAIDDAREALEALRGMQGQDLEAIKRECVAVFRGKTKGLKYPVKVGVRAVIDHLHAQNMLKNPRKLNTSRKHVKKRGDI